eukprot:364326-Chlamydomonas_euryale.AAC.12
MPYLVDPRQALGERVRHARIGVAVNNQGGPSCQRLQHQLAARICVRMCAHVCVSALETVCVRCYDDRAQGTVRHQGSPNMCPHLFSHRLAANIRCTAWSLRSTSLARVVVRSGKRQSSHGTCARARASVCLCTHTWPQAAQPTEAGVGDEQGAAGVWSACVECMLTARRAVVIAVDGATPGRRSARCLICISSCICRTRCFTLPCSYIFWKPRTVCVWGGVRGGWERDL